MQAAGGQPPCGREVFPYGGWFYFQKAERKQLQPIVHKTRVPVLRKLDKDRRKDRNTLTDK